MNFWAGSLLLGAPAAGWLIDQSLRRTLSEPFFNNTLIGHESSVWSVAYSPDGRWLASGSNDAYGPLSVVQVWDTQNLEAAPRLLGGHE